MTMAVTGMGVAVTLAGEDVGADGADFKAEAVVGLAVRMGLVGQ